MKQHRYPEIPWIMFSGVILFASCASTRRHEFTPEERPPTTEEISKWRSQQQLSVATEEEVAAAKSREKSFSRNRASSGDGKLKVVFNLGELTGGKTTNLSTTSTYSLLDANGRLLAKAPSCIANTLGIEKDDLGDQIAWFPPDGKRVVVYEYANYGLGPPPMTILFFEDDENPGSWKCRFMELPFYDEKFYYEGAHAKCRGILGDELLIDASTRDGEVSKKKIREMKDTYPFPFTMG